MLVVRAGGRVCALPLANVLETTRPLPVEPLAGAPPFVAGVTVVRGVAAPVVTLNSILDAPADGAPARFVRLQVGERTVCLAVDEVRGVIAPDEAAVLPLPPLLDGARAQAVEALGTLDRALLVVLAAGRLVPEELFARLAAGETP